MTRPDLDALAAMLDKATPGPWSVCYDRNAAPQHVISARHVVAKGKRGNVLARKAEDADLIVAAVNALPALLAYVRELEQERDALRGMLDLASAIPSMTDEQLEELRQNAKAAAAIRGIEP